MQIKQNIFVDLQPRVEPQRPYHGPAEQFGVGGRQQAAGKQQRLQRSAQCGQIRVKARCQHPGGVAAAGPAQVKQQQVGFLSGVIQRGQLVPQAGQQFVVGV